VRDVNAFAGAGKTVAMTTEDSGQLKDEAEAAAAGRAEHTPFALLGGLTVAIGLIVGVVIAAGLLVWWLA
jgi:hypothetical protein